MSSRLCLTLLIFGFVLALSGCATRNASHIERPSATAVIREATPEGAQIVRQGGSWQKAASGVRVHEGDRVRTGSDGTITIHLGPNGGVMRIMPRSEAIFERIGPSPADPDVLAIIFLTAGRIVGDTMNPPAGGKILIRTLGGTHELE